MKKNLLSEYYRPKSTEIHLRIFLISILLFFVLSVPVSRAEIEIYSAGQYFKSFEDYQKGQHQIVVEKLEMKDSLNEESLISKEQQMALEKIGYDHGVYQGLTDFQKNGNATKSGLVLDADDLEESIRETLINKTEPTLLIFDSGKMRIMSFSQMDKSTKE